LNANVKEKEFKKKGQTFWMFMYSFFFYLT